jgi:hypothetical protein
MALFIDILGSFGIVFGYDALVVFTRTNERKYSQKQISRHKQQHHSNDELYLFVFEKINYLFAVRSFFSHYILLFSTETECKITK